MKLARIREELKGSYGIKLSKMQLYKANDESEGSHGESYPKLQAYNEVERVTTWIFNKD